MKCIICGELINSDRREALEFLGKSDRPTCILHGDSTKIKGIYNGFSGVAPLIIVKDVGTDKTLYHESEPDNLKDFSYSLSDEE